VMSEVRQVWGQLGGLTTRLWAGSGALEVEWTVGPPPDTGPATNWDVFVRHSSNIESGGWVSAATNWEVFVRHSSNIESGG